jgi:hypothetical protein
MRPAACPTSTSKCELRRTCERALTTRHRNETRISGITWGLRLPIRNLFLQNQYLDGNAWRRECQSISIDVQAVFHFSTWEPTVLATSNWPVPCARYTPSICAIFRRPGRGGRSPQAAATRKMMKGLIAANHLLRLRFTELRAAVSKGYSRGRLPQVCELKDAREKGPAVLTFVLPNQPIAESTSAVRHKQLFA